MRLYLNLALFKFFFFYSIYYSATIVFRARRGRRFVDGWEGGDVSYFFVIKK